MIPYHLTSSLGGQSDYENKGIAGSFKNGINLDIRKRNDTLTCQQALTDDLVTGVMSDLALFQVPADDGNIYSFTRSGQIFSRHSDGTYHQVFTETNEGGHILGAAQWYDSAGNTFLFWATATRLNVKRILGASYTNVEPWTDVNTAPTGTWPKVNLTAAPWHTMKVCTGTLQIVNGQFLAFVGYDFSYTNQALQLIPGNVGQTLVERGIYTIIGTQRSVGIDESSLYAWDGLSLDYNNKEIIKIKGLNAMIDTEYALMQVGTDGALYISDLNNPMPLTSFYGGGRCYPDAVTSYKGMALFGVFGNSSVEGVQNGIWSFGRLKKNAPAVLNFDYQLDCDEIGSVLATNDDIFITYRKGTDYGVKHIDTANKAPAVYQSLDLVTPLGTRRYPIPLDRMLNWDHARIECSPLPAGSRVELWYRIDKVKDQTLNANANLTTGWIQANLVDLSLSETNTGRMDLVFLLGEKARVLEAMIKLFPYHNLTPEVHEQNYYFTVGG